MIGEPIWTLRVMAEGQMSLFGHHISMITLKTQQRSFNNWISHIKRIAQTI